MSAPERITHTESRITLPRPYLITMQIDVINYTIKYKQFAVKVSSVDDCVVIFDMCISMYVRLGGGASKLTPQ